MQKYRVLFFDSGLGGISIYQEVMKINKNIIPVYLFDSSFFPYGNKPEEQIKERVTAIFCKVSRLFDIDLAVIACNTASTIALSAVRNEVPFPVVGVVPAVKPAAEITGNGVIGLLATPGTIHRKYTDKLIDNFAKNIQVLRLGTTELVKLSEKKMSGIQISDEAVRTELKSWINLKVKPDTIVLGCTHFPHLRKEIQKVFPEAKLIDSGEAVARRVASLLKLISPKNNEIFLEKKYDFTALCTDKKSITLQAENLFKKFGFSKLEEITI